VRAGFVFASRGKETAPFSLTIHSRWSPTGKPAWPLEVQKHPIDEDCRPG